MKKKKNHYITKLKGKLNLEKPALFMTAEIGAKMNFLVSLACLLVQNPGMNTHPRDVHRQPSQWS